MENQARQKFYLTTAIMYTNGLPHCGHAYETISADVISRYHRIAGKDVFFLTGTDEHGQKVAESAAKENLTPIEMCNQIVEKYLHLNKSFSISNDRFIRTTEKCHYDTCTWLWNQSVASGDIYLGKYEGWYNTREEKFVTETEAQACEYIDVGSGKPLTKTSEPSYFFKLSKYQARLIEHIKNNPNFILPEERRIEILSRLEEPLIDLSISRTTFDWGVPIQSQGEAEKHVMYVWFDALTNYLTGVDYPTGERARFWPPNVQIVGKDIAWFHTVIWPCMLFSTNIELPVTVFSHGFVNDKFGRKMSKSIGNIVDPLDMLSKYTSDNLRYYLMRDGVFGGDISFHEEALIARHDNELQGALGNLVRRALTLCKYSNMTVPDAEPYELFNVSDVKKRVDEHFNKFAIHSAIEEVFEQLRAMNCWLAEKAPWLMPEDQLEEKKKIVRTILEGTYILGHLIQPVIPNAIEAYFKDLNHLATTLPHITGWKNLEAGRPVSVGDLLFPRIGENRHEKAKHSDKGEAEKASGQQPSGSQPQQGGKGKGQQQQKGGGKGAQAKVEELPLDVRKLDLRVGLITSCKPHRNPTGSHLYEEEIDVGEPTKRTVVSGLAKYIPVEEMQNRLCVVVCNMKPSAFKGVTSEAMVLCANSGDGNTVELVEPPVGSVVGERIACEGYNTAQDKTPPQLNPKKKEFESVKPDLRTNAEGVATYKGVPLSTSVGVCKPKSLKDAPLG